MLFEQQYLARRRFMKRHLMTIAFGLVIATPTLAQQNSQGQQPAQCSISPVQVNNLQSKLATVVQSGNGGLFTPNLMWSAVVDRQGVLCSIIRSHPDAWPGSRSIAIAKASTANDFSNSQKALSTANLYSFTQPANTNTSTVPAGSLYGLNNSNPFNPAFQPQGTAVGSVPGGIITFGGGVPLYSNGQVIGGLGVSGDTACADHAIAFRMRKAAGLDGTPGGNGSDNIQYLALGELPNGFFHPHCIPSDITP
jgi:uncharacterized protein GlcG (DUF336 family)